MKRYFIFLLIGSFLITGCSKKDSADTFYEPLGIEFVLQDGTPILAGDCIDPDANYAIRIRVSTGGDTSVKTTVIQYTVNGNLSSVTFTNSQTKTINVPIVEGENIAQLVNSGFGSSIYLLATSEYEIVP